MKAKAIILLGLLVNVFLSSAQEYTEVKRYKAHHAHQAVAVGRECFFAIENTHITKFSMDGDSLMTWHEADKERICHLNSGVVIGNKLYCAHSNYPSYPFTKIFLLVHFNMNGRSVQQ